jgi:hypothetical protein
MSLFDPNRGRLVPPNLDDRVWTDMVDEARALIPKYAPQWTDHGPSDIGITLVELFAWLVEGLTYRLNQVPEKNYIAFLNLLGITRDPPEPARSYLTFSATPSAVVVPKGRQAQTAGSETEAPVIFETDQDVLILPINLKVALLIRKPGYYTNVSSQLTVPPAIGETVTVPVGQSVQLRLGFDAATTQTMNLNIRMFQPAGPNQAFIAWQFSNGASWPNITVGPGHDGTNGLQQSGIVQLNVPNTWTSQAPSGVLPATPGDTVTNSYFWIGVLISNLTPQPLQIGFNWILFNSVSAFNALTIPAPEQVGVGDGTPFQVYALANGPLFRRPDTDTPYDHLVVQVNKVTWAQVDDFPAGAGQVYRVNAVTAEISFGNFDAIQGTGHGSVPALGDIIVATTYRYVAGGISGNVGTGKIVTMRTPVAGITSVTNLFSAYGGSDAEGIEETKRRAPELLRNRYRAVTTEDYEFLTAEASTELATQRCLEPRFDFSQPFGGLDRSPGNVNIVIVPNIGPALSPTPQATPELIHEVVRYLDRRRDITARMNVSGPKYLPVDVSIAASAWQKAIDQGLISGPGDVQAYISQKIQQYLHPVVGGLDGKGWQVGQNVFIADLYKAVMPSQDIGFISTLQIQSGTPLYKPPNRPFAPTPLGAWVLVADYELVCLGKINWLGPVLAV